MIDEELISKIVNQQIFQIRLQQLFKNHPLAMPPLTPEERVRQDAEWQEAIKRGLHKRINLLVHFKIKDTGDAP